VPSAWAEITAAATSAAAIANRHGIRISRTPIASHSARIRHMLPRPGARSLPPNGRCDTRPPALQFSTLLLRQSAAREPMGGASCTAVRFQAEC
jgi:hypothetical protein